jgi:hypothetical protein
VKNKYVLTDGDRRLEIYWVPNAGHSANLLMSYLPRERVLFITDIFNEFGEPRPNDPPPGSRTRQPWERRLRSSIWTSNSLPRLMAKGSHQYQNSRYNSGQGASADDTTE